jgi:beta-glucosidase
MKLISLFAIVTLAILHLGISATANTPNIPTYQNPKAPVEARVQDLLGRLTQAEKLSLLTFPAPEALSLNTPPIPHLGVPALRTTDATDGLRDGPATAFPMGVVMASTWDTPLIEQVGAAIGQEARAKNRQIVYGPDLNIQRSPQSGRSFECFSEDPYLVGQMGDAYIDGMQSEDVAACAKHFIGNDQETHRHDGGVIIDERTLHEIYLPPFRDAVFDAHIWSMMVALNQLDGVWMADNKPLLTGLVDNHWHWDGLWISDWGSVHDTAGAANAGTDIEMPQPQFFAPDALTAALKKGEITQATIDDMVRRVLRVMVRTGRLDPPQKPDLSAMNSPAHQQVALKVAQEGIILLKNAHQILPLDRHTIKSIAVIGPNAADTQLGGRWSADVTPFFQVSVLDGIRKAAGANVGVQFALGCPRTDPSAPKVLAEAVALAAKSDIAVVVVGTDNNYEGEELDPPNIDLPGDQNALIQAVSAVNKHTIVVLNQGTPMLMPWLDQISGLVESWYAGQSQGDAVAQILFGDVDPSGKLTETIAARREDYSDYGFYPGVDNQITYGEGLYVGYRHFDKANITPLFPFGFGLSYTTFRYSDLKVGHFFRQGEPLLVHVTVQNTGHRAGAEIVELYVHPLNPTIDRPIKELKGFARVSLAAGAKTTVTIPLERSAFAYWDVTHHSWRAVPGRYEIQVGASSRDIRMHSVVDLTYPLRK